MEASRGRAVLVVDLEQSVDRGGFEVDVFQPPEKVVLSVWWFGPCVGFGLLVPAAMLGTGEQGETCMASYRLRIEGPEMLCRVRRYTVEVSREWNQLKFG